MLNESLVKYLAGLLDADGSLSFAFKRDMNNEGRSYLGLILALSASDAIDKHGFVERLPELTGFGSTSRYGPDSRIVKWSVTGRADLEMLLPRLLKHMVIKAQHWDWLLSQWRSIRAHSKSVSVVERETLTELSKQSRQSRIGPLKAKNHPTWAWFAGYMDGDGWYSYRRHYAKTNGYWQWSIHMGAGAHVNDASVLTFLHNSFGGSIQDHGKNSNVKVWRVSLGYQNRSFALNNLPKLAKHSRLKKEKIEAIIHHHRQRLSVPGVERTYCTVDGCGAPSHGRGLCSKHYQQAWKLEKAQAIV